MYLVLTICNPKIVLQGGSGELRSLRRALRVYFLYPYHVCSLYVCLSTCCLPTGYLSVGLSVYIPITQLEQTISDPLITRARMRHGTPRNMDALSTSVQLQGSIPCVSDKIVSNGCSPTDGAVCQTDPNRCLPSSELPCVCDTNTITQHFIV